MIRWHRLLTAGTCFVAGLLTVGCSPFELASWSPAARVTLVECDLEITLDDDVTALQRRDIERRLMDLDEVGSVTYVSKDQALARAREIFAESPDVLENLPANPFPATFRVDLDRCEATDTVRAAIERAAGVAAVEDPDGFRTYQ